MKKGVIALCVALAAIVHVSNPPQAAAVICWYCSIGDTCYASQYNGSFGGSGCYMSGSHCVLTGLCPLYIAGPAGIDAGGLVVSGCGRSGAPLVASREVLTDNIVI